MLWVFHIWLLLHWDSFFLFLVCWVFYVVNFFFCISWDDHMFFFLHSVLVVINFRKLINFLNHPCTSGINSNGSWCIIPLLCCWIQFDSILLKVFVLMLIRDIGLWFSFLVVPLSGYGMSNASLRKWVWKYFLLFSCLEEFEKNWH